MTKAEIKELNKKESRFDKEFFSKERKTKNSKKNDILQAKLARSGT